VTSRVPTTSDAGDLEAVEPERDLDTIAQGSLPSSMVSSPKKLGRLSAVQADSHPLSEEGIFVAPPVMVTGMGFGAMKEAITQLDKANADSSPSC
jgi:hypothetical protein